MSSDWEKRGMWLLAGAVFLGAFLVNGQQRLDRQVDRLESEVANAAREANGRFASMAAMAEMRESIPDWMSQPETRVTVDPQCRNYTATVSWNLKEWSPGTTAMLQYRGARGEAWQEVDPTDLGQHSYEATFPLGGEPGVIWTINVGKADPTGAVNPRTVYWPREVVQRPSDRSGVPVRERDHTASRSTEPVRPGHACPC
ncbi:MAG TPA: hypothetical protein VD902_17975 [Symbiobacteriaceae bacterium]|nr:hypothetical protein [Symbiobacteriaceae bacterium]